MKSVIAPPAVAQPPSTASASLFAGSTTTATGPTSAASASAVASPSLAPGDSGSLFAIANEYVNRMLPADRTMKVLLVDRTTLPIISMSYTQTHLLNKGVFLVDQVTGSRQRREMKTMRCIFFIRPDGPSVDAVCGELRQAKYSNYSVVFCGAAGPDLLDRLARADVAGLVTQVEEVFCDYCAVNRDTFMLEIAPPNALASAQVPSSQVRRVAEGLAAMSVAMRRRPLLRFQKSSPFVRRVVQELEDIYKRDPELYNYRSKDTVLLVLDRSDDPVTPLLTPWTYQAMLHEHVGLDHNKLLLPDDVKGAEKDGYVFSQQDDLFFAANMFLNWGDLCNNVKTYVERCKAALNLDRSTATMEEIKQFMQKMPQTKSLTGSVTKHTTVVAHLSSVVKQRDLLEISLLEQDMVASDNESDHWTRLQAFAARRDVHEEDLLRLCLIFHLRYERAGQASRTAPILDRMGSSHTQLLRKLREYYGKDKPTDGLFAETGVMAKIVKTFVDVGNIYTQHQPVLRRTLLDCYSGRLDTTHYPYARSSIAAAPSQANNNNAVQLSGDGYKPREVMVYLCGGFTFEEAALIHAVNAGTAFKPSETGAMVAGGGIRALLGGETALSSREFVQELYHLPLPA